MNDVTLKEFTSGSSVSHENPSISEDLTGRMVTRIRMGKPYKDPSTDDMYRFCEVWTVPPDSLLPLGNDLNHKFYGYTFTNDDRTDEELEKVMIVAVKKAGATGHGVYE